MPLDAASHTFLHSKGGFLRNRYCPLPILQEHTPASSTSSSPSNIHTEVRLYSDYLRPKVHIQQSPRVIKRSNERHSPPSPHRPPISRPCMRFRNDQQSSISSRTPRYYKLTENDAGPTGPRTSLGVRSGERLLRAVANRGRGYEDLRYRGGNYQNSGGSSPASSPRNSPSVSPKGHQSGGILITSTLAKSGIKRFSRVSFGSSKGSMVETLIFDSPVAEDDRIPEEDLLITDPVAQKLGTETAELQKPASKVRVTFFECEKPLAVTTPEPPEFYGQSFFDLPMSSPTPDTVLPSLDRQLRYSK